MRIGELRGGGQEDEGGDTHCVAVVCWMEEEGGRALVCLRVKLRRIEPARWNRQSWQPREPGIKEEMR